MSYNNNNSSLRKYLVNTSGNVSIMFGLLLTGLVVAIGAAIDTSGATKEKSRLQAMSDIAALAAASSGETELNDLKAIVEKSLESNNVNDIQYEWNLILTEDGIELDVHTIYDTALMGVIGIKEVDVGVLSTVSLAKADSINLALVLDATLSMQGDNMTNLKSAATNLIDSIDDDGLDVQVSIVPFATYVKIDTVHANASWADIPADYDVERTTRDVIHPHLCTESEVISEKDGVEIILTNEDCPEEAYGPEIIETSTREWAGCMGSRSGIHRAYPEYGSKKIPGLNHYSCGTPLLPLTDNYDNIRSKIEDLNARDNTYIPSGLIWGWRTLDKQLPFNEAASLTGERQNAMILMSDGHNVSSKGARLSHEKERPEADAFHEERDGLKADAFTAELCRNIKNDNIRIFVIAYKLNGLDTVSTQNTLRNCATSIEDFYSAQNGTQLNASFKSIRDSFGTIHLSR